jgi:predicted outer membrane protein
MKLKKLRLPQLMATMLLTVGSCMAVDAQTTNAAMSGSNNTSSRPSGAMSADAAFIQKNINSNMVEIQMAQMAIDKGSSSRVREAGRQMVSDHTQMLADLRRVGRKLNVTGMGDDMNSGAGMGNTQSGNAGSGVSGNQNAGSGNTGSAGTSGSGTVGSGNSQPGSAGSVNSGSGNSGSGNSGAGNSGSGNSGSGSAGMGTTGSGTAGSQQENPGMHGMTALQNATGETFDRIWASEMLAMHETKLSELSTSLNTLSDPELKSVVTSAIPKIKMHRDMLAQQNPGKKSGTNSGVNSGNNSEKSSGTNPGNNPGKNSGKNSGKNPGTNSGNNSGSGTGGSGTGSGTGSGSGTGGSGTGGSGTGGSGTGGSGTRPGTNR